MADNSLSNCESPLSSNTIIAIISSLLIVIILYPWIIAVTVICFIIGFTGLEHLDKFTKTSISTGRFGPLVQSRFKDYINLTGESESKKNVIEEVTADPLRDLIEETEQKKSTTVHQQQHNEALHQISNKSATTTVITNSAVFGTAATHNYNSLVIPARLSSSNRSSPEKNRSLFESPKRSLSAASSRRVSEDIPGSAHSLIAPFSMVGGASGLYHQSHNHRRDNSNKTPSPSRSSTAASSPSPSIALNTEIVGTLQVDQEFRVDARVDKAFGRLCTNIIDYYISSSWAPYETRRQLKLSFKQLLNSVAEQCNRKLLCGKKSESDAEKETPKNAPLVKLAKEKILPLAVHYLDKILARDLLSKINADNPIISEESEKRNILKIRKFCRQIFARFLNKDDKNCKLWTDLCVAVLADGVLVNAINLGKEKLPELLEELVERFKKSSKVSLSNTVVGDQSAMSRAPSQMGSVKDENDFVDPLSEDFVEALQELQEEDKEVCPKENGYHNDERPPVESSSGPVHAIKEESSRGSANKVPFLLDSFLDPPYNLEKPDPIVSRWRPTIRDIVSETDLLYPLIQYMKHVGGQQSLAYLQGVLDEFPLDGDPHCRRILELEYLPGFCRSSLFLETMGLSKVEMAMEVGTDPFGTPRRNSGNGNGGHIRSASYGGPSSSSLREFLKLEQGIVDGLPLTESSQPTSSATSSSLSDPATPGGGTGAASGSTATLPIASEIQPSLAFKRRPHLEMYIAKFIKSTSKSWKQYYDPQADQYERSNRAGAGTDAKSYEDWDHPEVNSRVKIESSNGEIYDSLIDIVTTLMRSSPTASPFFSGLATFLKPYLMPLFNEQLDQNFTEMLSDDLLITVVDLIADVYEVRSDTNDCEVDNKNDSEVTNNGSIINNHLTKTDEFGNFARISSNFSPVHAIPASSSTPLPPNINCNTSEEESHEYHNSSCTTCDPSFKSTVESFLRYILECFMLKLIDLDYFVKCFSKNREYVFLFFVDLLDVLVGELVEESTSTE